MMPEVTKVKVDGRDISHFFWEDGWLKVKDKFGFDLFEAYIENENEEAVGYFLDWMDEQPETSPRMLMLYFGPFRSIQYKVELYNLESTVKFCESRDLVARFMVVS